MSNFIQRSLISLFLSAVFIILAGHDSARAEYQPVGTITGDAVPVRTGPGTQFDRLCHADRRIRFAVIGAVPGWTKVRLSPTLSGWVNNDDIRIRAHGDRPSSPRINRIKVAGFTGKTRVSFELSERGAFQVRQKPAPPFIEVRFFGATASLFEVLYDPNDSLVSEVILNQEEDYVAGAEIFFHSPPQWGYDFFWEKNTLILDIKHAPDLSKNPDFPLSGLTVVIDPGHGGKDLGAVGVLGMKEKDANIDIACDLLSRLKGAGATVVQTRSGDYELLPHERPAVEELSARVRVGKNNSGTVFVSIHNNALPDVEQARRAKGTYVYFSNPGSHNLASCIATALARAIGEGTFAAAWRSFHVTRQTLMPAVLVEVAFISNPAEELKLANPSFRREAARGIYEGIVNYISAFQTPAK
jgi:N-acetylmuramoyl-L-alanine amidase